MPILLQCPNAACGKRLQVKDDHAGKVLKCPACQKPVTVPLGIAPQTPASTAGDASLKKQEAPRPPALEAEEGSSTVASQPANKSGISTHTAPFASPTRSRLDDVAERVEQLCAKGAAARRAWEDPKKLVQAEELFRAAILESPNEWKAHFGLGDVLLFRSWRTRAPNDRGPC